MDFKMGYIGWVVLAGILSFPLGFWDKILSKRRRDKNDFDDSK